MGHRLEEICDWSTTPLGPPGAWPPELRTAVLFVLESKFPTALVWGEELATVYNEAFTEVRSGGRDWLGRSFCSVCGKTWSKIHPFVVRAFAGEATFLENYPLLIERSGRAEQAYYTFCFSPVRMADGTVGGIMVSVVETTVHVENLHRLRESEGRFLSLVEGTPQVGVWRAHNGGQLTWASPQWTNYTGQLEHESLGLGWLDVIHPDDRGRMMELWQQAEETGIYRVEFRLRHASGRQYRWFQAHATPVRDGEGKIVEWVGTSMEVHDLRMLEERQRVLVAELQHRVRNMLTVVRSVFARTADASGEREDLVNHFSGRLDALARTQAIATKSALPTVDLENLIRDELLSVGVTDGPQVRIAGPDVALPPEAVEPIGLAIHELTTNALKYGALKVPGAKLDICWTLDLDYGGGRRLNLTWSEHGVPAIPVQPIREGFGRELIEEALPYQLGADTRLEFRGGGVRCSISLPLGAGQSDVLADTG